MLCPHLDSLVVSAEMETPTNLSLVLYFVQRYGVVVCTQRHTCIAPDGKHNARNHFCYPPHCLKGLEFTSVEKQLKDLPLKRMSEIPYPKVEDQPVPAVPHLAILNGWICTKCSEWVSTSLSHSRAHVSSQHGIRAGKYNQGLESCRVQTFFRERQKIRYFRVAEGVPEEQQLDLVAVQEARSANGFLKTQLDVLTRIKEEAQREVEKVCGFEEHKSAVIPWVKDLWLRQVYQGP